MTRGKDLLRKVATMPRAQDRKNVRRYKATVVEVEGTPPSQKARFLMPGETETERPFFPVRGSVSAGEGVFVEANASGYVVTGNASGGGGPVADLSGYQTRSEKGQAGGYAPLDSGLLVPRQHLGSGTRDGTRFLRDDGTWQTIPGGASSGSGATTALQRRANLPVPTSPSPWVVVPWDFEAQDDAGWFDPTEPALVPLPGPASYWFLFNSSWNSSTAGRRTARVVRASDDLIEVEQPNVAADLDSYGRGLITWAIAVPAGGDSYRLEVWHNAGATINFGRAVATTAYPQLKVMGP